MNYKDEFGFEINLPKLPKESAMEAYKSSNDTLIELLRLWTAHIGKGTVKNPLIVRAE